MVRQMLNGTVKMNKKRMAKKGKTKDVRTVVAPEVVDGGTYSDLVGAIGELLERARERIATTANTTLVETYWSTGRYIVEYEQHGADRAKYGDALISRLARDLTVRHGRGFSKTNILYMRKLYLTFRKGETLSHFLYLNYFAAEEGTKIENAPIGIILGADKDDLVVEYAIRGITNRIFVSRYQLYLPDKEQLRRELASAIEAEEGRHGRKGTKANLKGTTK